MQVGGFFECYAIDNEEEKTNSENLYFICDFMNIQISIKNIQLFRSSRPINSKDYHFGIFSTK